MQAAKAHHTLLEINNSSLKPCRNKVEARPNNLEILRLCKQYEVPVILGSDAHISFDIATYDHALELVKETEFPESLILNTDVARFKQYLHLDSSSAEEIMRTLVRRAGREKEFEIDSAGISGFHEGELPDERMRSHASRRGYQLTHRSRPVRTEDFYHFDWILGMDDRNIDALRDKAPDVESEQKIHRMTDFCRTKVIDYVPDPYYGGAQGFENVLDILEDACEGLLAHLSNEKK